MNFLLIGSTDSYNQSLLSIAQDFINLGEKVLILLSEKEVVHNHMLLNKDVETVYWYDFDSYAEYEVVLYGNILNQEVLQKVLAVNSLKIGLFFHLVIDEYVLGGANLYADFTLCFGEKFVENQKRNGVVHNLIPVGVPFESKQKEAKYNEKVFLFLEQHFYPSGDKGKQQLADFLVTLASEKNEYKIVVKPRALPNETKTKHKAKHIYEYFTHLPSNLILLEKHYDLETLIDSAEIVATTFSTAITDAILQNKRVLFIEGFSMVETYFYNKPMVNRYYKIYKESGNLMHYNDVIDKFDFITSMNSKFKNKMFYRRKKRLSIAVYDFIKDAQSYKNTQVDNLTIENYQESLKLAHKKSNYILLDNLIIEKFYRINIITGFRLETERVKLLKFLKSLKKKAVTVDVYESKIAAMQDELIDCGINRILKEYKKFPIGFKSLYLKYLYDKNMQEECNRLPSSWHIADYFYNKYLFSRNNKYSARVYLEKYIKVALHADYKYTPLYDDAMIENMQKTVKFLEDK